MPVSATVSTARPSWVRTWTVTEPPGSVYLMPLLIRLSISSLSRPSGTATTASSPLRVRRTSACLAEVESSSTALLATALASERSSHWSMATDSSSESLRMSLIRSMSRSTSTPIMVMNRF